MKFKENLQPRVAEWREHRFNPHLEDCYHLDAERLKITIDALRTLAKAPSHFAPAWCRELLKMYE